LIRYRRKNFCGKEYGEKTKTKRYCCGKKIINLKLFIYRLFSSPYLFDDSIFHFKKLLLTLKSFSHE